MIGIHSEDRKRDDKALKFEAFYDLVLRTHDSKRPESLNASFLSRELGVSRAWIYKYFGSSKEKWIEAAFRETARIVANLNLANTISRNKAEAYEHWKADARRLLDNLEQRPWLVLLYFRYGGNTNHLLHDAFRDLESR